MKIVPLLFGALCASAIACGAPTDAASTQSTAGAVEISTPDLWAGLTSYTIERYTSDPCDGGANRLDNAPIVYDEWARERAGVRNVCFEVWKPGVTDTDNPDYWRALDVEVHYQYKGASDAKTAYVGSIDRRGNNRRYAWSLDYELDPERATQSVIDVRAPFEIVSEAAEYFEIRSELDFHFTVNGNKLSSSTNGEFKVSYQGYLRKPKLDVPAAGVVLHSDVECAGGALRLGSAAGFLAADVRGDAVQLFGQGLDGSMIYATDLGRDTDAKVLSLVFDAIYDRAPGELPDYVAGSQGDLMRAEARQSAPSTMTLTVRAYDRAAKRVRALSRSFDGCHKV